MPTLCFGGTFNPPHHGHLRCAQAVAGKAGYDKVVLIPTGQPPHKRDEAAAAELAPAHDRLVMCQRATRLLPLFDVSDIETRHLGVSYTIDTARRLRQQGMREVHWLIGADMLLHLPHWHRPDELLREVRFVVMARPGWHIDWNAVPERIRHLQDHVVEAPQVDISGTEIRARVRQGLPIDHLVPPAVAEYITERGLYR